MVLLCHICTAPEQHKSFVLCSGKKVGMKEGKQVSETGISAEQRITDKDGTGCPTEVRADMDKKCVKDWYISVLASKQETGERPQVGEHTDGRMASALKDQNIKSRGAQN